MKPLEQIIVENNEFVIFAAQPHEPHTVMDYMARNGIPFQILLGSYKGELETSYIVPATRLSDIYASNFLEEQESILILGVASKEGTRPARLKFLKTETFGSEVQELGQLTRVSMDEALAQDGWTFNPMLGSYFTIKSSE